MGRLLKGVRGFSSDDRVSAVHAPEAVALSIPTSLFLTAHFSISYPRGPFLSSQDARADSREILRSRRSVKPLKRLIQFEEFRFNNMYMYIDKRLIHSSG